MSALRCTVDFDAEGKQVGVLWVPDAYDNASAWGSMPVPIACIRNGDGPAVLLMGGNHGDEYEGQVALRRLVAETGVEDINGTLIVMPCLSVPASRAAQRLWPDGTNFNRAFPGSPSGRPHALLADYLTTELFPRVDVVGDFHSGGRSLLFPPMATMHLVDDPDQRRAMFDAALAMNTEWLLVYADMGGDGLLPGEAERQGKIVVSSELGGAGILTTESTSAAHRGITNVARQVGVLRGEVRTREQPTRIVSAVDADNYVLSPRAGLLEPLVAFGTPVGAGEPLALIYAFDELEREPFVVPAPTDGLVLASRPLPVVERGDCIAMIGREVDVATLS